jgi:hypothetical protein
VVKEDFDVERDKYGRIITDKDRERMAAGGGGSSRRDRSRSPRGGGGRHHGGGGDGGMVNFGNTYGLSPRFLESLGIDCELHTRVFVANLDYAVSFISTFLQFRCVFLLVLYWYVAEKFIFVHLTFRKGLTRGDCFAKRLKNLLAFFSK